MCQWAWKGRREHTYAHTHVHCPVHPISRRTCAAFSSSSSSFPSAITYSRGWLSDSVCLFFALRFFTVDAVKASLLLSPFSLSVVLSGAAGGVGGAARDLLSLRLTVTDASSSGFASLVAVVDGGGGGEGGVGVAEDSISGCGACGVGESEGVVTLDGVVAVDETAGTEAALPFEAFLVPDAPAPRAVGVGGCGGSASLVGSLWWSLTPFSPSPPAAIFASACKCLAAAGDTVCVADGVTRDLPLVCSEAEAGVAFSTRSTTAFTVFAFDPD